MMQFFLFDVGGQIFAYPLDHIKELVKSADYKVSVVPGANPVVCGITSIRDDFVTVLDAHLILGKQDIGRSFFLVVDSMVGKFALWIDGIDQIITVEESSIQQVVGRSIVQVNNKPTPIVGFRDGLDQLFLKLATDAPRPRN